MKYLLKEKIKAEALRLGFSFIGFSKPLQTPHFSQFESWLMEERPDDLNYLGKKYILEARKRPETLLDNAGTVISLGLSYGQPKDLKIIENQDNRDFGQIATYACLPDYHSWMKTKSKDLIAYIKNIHGPIVKSKFFVDSGPVMEKDFAYLSGLGWIGKNSLFISPVFGSHCLLGCLFVDFELQPDLPDETDLCGNCESCLNACPTGAISQNRTIKTSHCISFLTTSYKGIIPFELNHKIGKNVFGCDICQNVCPLNSNGRGINELYKNSLRPIIENRISLSSEISIGKEEYLEKYSNTPLSKFPYDLFLRNIIIAVGNSGLSEFFSPLINILYTHPSPIVRASAGWAISVLEPHLAKDVLIKALDYETKADARIEIEKIIALSG